MATACQVFARSLLRYILRSSGPGRSLQTALVLEAGKHLAAIRECGRRVQRPLPEDVRIGALTKGPLICFSWRAQAYDWRLSAPS